MAVPEDITIPEGDPIVPPVGPGEIIADLTGPDLTGLPEVEPDEVSVVPDRPAETDGVAKWREYAVALGADKDSVAKTAKPALIKKYSADDPQPASVIVADLTGDAFTNDAAAVKAAVDEASAPEPVVPDEPTEPDPTPEVSFVCDRWAGVSLYGQGIKFNDGLFTTADPVKIAVLDAWEHARRLT